MQWRDIHALRKFYAISCNKRNILYTDNRLNKINLFFKFMLSLTELKYLKNLLD